MQEELIEMLDKMVKYFDEIPSDSYYYRETAAILGEAEKLVEKAKNSAKEPAVPQGWKPVGYLRSDEFDGHTFEPIDGEWPFDELLFSLAPAPSQPAVPQGEPVAIPEAMKPNPRCIAQAISPFFTPGIVGHDSTALDRAVIAVMDAIGSSSPSQPDVPQESVMNWPLKAKVWKRESTQEWVLEIEGVLGETSINCRHTQPLSVSFEDVPGLPTLYREPVSLTLMEEHPMQPIIKADDIASMYWKESK